MIRLTLMISMLMLGCTRMEPDCLVEEWTEDFIEDYTGFDIDLTSEDGG